MSNGKDKGTGICCGLVLLFFLFIIVAENWNAISGLIYWPFLLIIIGIISHELYKATDKPIKISAASTCIVSFWLIIILILIASAGGVSEDTSSYGNTRLSTQSKAPATSPPTLKITTVPTTNPMLTQQYSLTRYKEGDIIQKSTTDTTFDKYNALVIIRVNNDGTYTVGQIYYDREVNKWWKSNEELPKIKLAGGIERDYPELIGQMNWQDIPIKYTYKQDGITKYSWTPRNVNKQPSYGIIWSQGGF